MSIESDDIINHFSEYSSKSQEEYDSLINSNSSTIDDDECYKTIGYNLCKCETDENISVDYETFIKFENVISEIKNNTKYTVDFKYKVIFLNVLYDIEKYDKRNLKNPHRTHYIKWFKSLFGY